MKEKYKFGFEKWGLILFAIIMLPNLIWFAVTAPNDVLRTASVTPVFDTVASVFQVVMVAFLCVLINKKATPIAFSKWVKTCIALCVLYFACWTIYYLGIVNSAVILGMTALPCSAFLFFAIDRKNYIAIFPITVFTVCHLIYAVVNFIV